MFVYLVSAAIAIVSVSAGERLRPDKPRASLALWCLAFVALLAPAALRYDIGVDYSATMDSAGYLGYYQLYQLYATKPPAPGMDPGFYLLIRFLNLFTGNPQWMFAIVSAATYALVLRACRRLSPEPVLSVALFLAAGFYFESYNIARQWFAIACVLNALEWAGDDRCGGGAASRSAFVRYALWVLLGSTMHVSCLLWLAMWPVLRMRLTPARAVAGLVVIVVAAFVGVRVVQLLFSGTRFGLYFDPSSEVYVGPRLRLNAVVTSGLTWAFSVGVLWVRGRRCDSGVPSAAGTLPASRPLRANGLTSALLACATVAFALDVSSAFLPFIVDRVARYFAPMLILLMPRVLEMVPDRRLRRVCAAVIVVAWLAATYVQVVMGGQYGVVPYQSVFGERAMAGILS